MEHKEFYKMAMGQDFPNVMVFEITAPPDESGQRTFSEQGLSAVTEQMKYFAMARLVAHYDRTGKPVKRMRATLSVEMFDEHSIDPEPLTEGAFPFYTIDDSQFLEISREHMKPLDK